MTFMLKDRSKEAPEETTVSTMGLLLSSPMSMYTTSEMSSVGGWGGGSLTVRSGEGAAQRGDRGAATHYELVRLALVVCGLGLGQHRVLHVQPGHNVDTECVIQVDEG